MNKAQEVFEKLALRGLGLYRGVKGAKSMSHIPSGSAKNIADTMLNMSHDQAIAAKVERHAKRILDAKSNARGWTKGQRAKAQLAFDNDMGKLHEGVKEYNKGKKRKENINAATNTAGVIGGLGLIGAAYNENRKAKDRDRMINSLNSPSVPVKKV